MKKTAASIIIILSVSMLCACAANTSANQEDEEMHNGLEDYTNIEVSGIDIDSLTDEQMEILLLQTRYCQAMTDADTDTMGSPNKNGSTSILADEFKRGQRRPVIPVKS